MKEVKENIFTVFDEILQRREKEVLLNQRSRCIWMTGLSGSGKTTIAKALERLFHRDGHLCQLLDGDNVRSGLCGNLGFSTEDRMENIRRIAEVSKLFVDCGVITINCFVSPTLAIREAAKDIIGSKDFLEVFIDTPLEVCEARDVKGLYKKARAGQIPDFTGISAPFEEPRAAGLVITTVDKSPESCAQEIYSSIKSTLKR